MICAWTYDPQNYMAMTFKKKKMKTMFLKYCPYLIFTAYKVLYMNLYYLTSF